MKNSKKSCWFCLLCLSLVAMLVVAVAAVEPVAAADNGVEVEQKILCVEQGSFAPLTPAETQTVSAGSRIMETPPQIEGYRPASVFGWCRISDVDVTLTDGHVVGSAPAEDYRIVLLYEKVYTVVVRYHMESVHYCTVTEQHRYSEGFRIEVPARVGHTTTIYPWSTETYTETVYIEGDAPTTANVVEYDVNYEPNIYNVIIDYYRPGDSEAWTSDAFPFRYGARYFIADFGRDGYRATPNSVSGTLNETQDVHCRVDLEPLEYVLTIEHCLGNIYIGEVFDTTTYSIPYGTEYNIPTHAYGERLPDVTAVTGVMPNRDITVRVSYNAGPGDFEPSPERPS